MFLLLLFVLLFVRDDGIKHGRLSADCYSHVVLSVQSVPAPRFEKKPDSRRYEWRTAPPLQELSLTKPESFLHSESKQTSAKNREDAPTISTIIVYNPVISTGRRGGWGRRGRGGTEGEGGMVRVPTGDKCATSPTVATPGSFARNTLLA